ncbi:PxKF domain-containing protein [Arthrobacter sp. MDT3-24]
MRPVTAKSRWTPRRLPLAYAFFLDTPAAVGPLHVLTLAGEPAVGATLTASTDYVEVGWGLEGCLHRYSWYVGGQLVGGAFGPTFVVPLAAGGKSVTARLDIAGVGCSYTAFASPPLYYDIETTAVFSSALGVLVCITFDTFGMSDDQAAGQHLYHYVGGAWADITDTALSGTGKVCGRTTSFSPFAVGQPRWPFRGFLQPVDNGGTLNAMKAGAAVPIKFGVGGNRGLDILAAGAPSSSAIACPGGAALDDIEQTMAAGSSSLSYAAGSDTYTYVWKTQKAWAGTCRQFTLGLNDGTTHTALFDFRK